MIIRSTSDRILCVIYDCDSHKTILFYRKMIRYVVALLLAFYILYPCPTAALNNSEISTKYFDFFFAESDRKTAESLQEDADILARMIMDFMDIEFDKLKLTPELISQAFKAGDDARELYIQDVTKCFDNHGHLDFKFAPDFGFPHHLEMFKYMVMKIKGIKNE